MLMIWTDPKQHYLLYKMHNYSGSKLVYLLIDVLLPMCYNENS